MQPLKIVSNRHIWHFIWDRSNVFNHPVTSPGMCADQLADLGGKRLLSCGAGVPHSAGERFHYFVHQFRLNYREDVRRTEPIILCFGKPLDCSKFFDQPPRMTLYKRCSDHVLNAIRELGERERELRAKCRSGDIGNDDPNWLTRRVRRRRSRARKRELVGV